MWGVFPTMRQMNSSHVLEDLNGSCVNETCTQPDLVGELQWGLLALIVVILCTALGNLLVCLAVCCERRLQNMTNYFLMSLAIADFLVSIIVMPFGMVVEIFGYFPLGAKFCAFWVTMDVFMCTASIWHMCTMSMDRYFTLKYPMQYGRNKTRTMVVVKIVFVWAVSFTISCPISIYGLINEEYVFNDRICVIALKEFIIYGSIFAFYVPLCIMILTYTLTIRILWQNQHMMRTMDRSHIKMRNRSNFSNSKSCPITTLLSPPSSESRKESHTEVSSLARTPNIDKLSMADCTESELKFLEMKTVLDQAYLLSLRSISPNTDTDNQDHSGYETENEASNIEDNAERVDDTDNENNGESKPTSPWLNVPIATVQIQSPSSDDDDECSALLSSSTERLPRSISRSSTNSKFRLRTNTSSSNKSYLTTHSSLKIPKTYEKYEKNNLQASVSCSNFTDSSRSKDKELFESLCLQGGGLNRDYKSLEWCHHFYEIQQEMDECLKESRKERKLKNLEAARQRLNSPSNKELTTQNSDETQDSGIAVSLKKEDDHTNLDQATESEDLLDAENSTSENNSDVVSIKLKPQSVYMYKLETNGNSLATIQNNTCRLQNNAEILKNNVERRRQRYLKDSSFDSDKSSEINQRLIRKPSSLKRFINKCKKRQGMKNLASSKTTSNERKASKVLGIIFAVFVILWTPFFIANILSVTCVSCTRYITPEMMSSFVWMGYIASLANPIIYTMFNTAFRRAFIKILKCHLCVHGRATFYRQSIPQQASLFNDRRQTLTVLTNGKQERIPSDIPSNLSLTGYQ